MNKRLLSAATLTLTLLNIPMAKAAVTLMEKDDWKATMNGFVEADFINDSTRSLNEIIGSSPVGRTGTFAGDNGRTMFSNHNSRLGFSLYSPEVDGWKSKGVLEFDFFGANAGTTEVATYQNPELRIRHAYFATENNGWKIVTGQTWSLFGWQPYYFPTLMIPAPGPGQLFQRNTQFMLMKDMKFGDSNLLQAAVSAERPSQRDSQMPNLNVGVRWSLDSYRSVFASSYGDIGTQALSVGLSGSFRQFQTGSPNSTSGQGKTNTSAFAADILVPILPATDEKDRGNSLTLTAEFTAGDGYGDSLPNWSGGMKTWATGATAGATSSANTNMDPGLGGFDAAGNSFTAVKLQTYNVALQYVLPESWHSWITGGYTETYSPNMGDFNATENDTSATSLYDKSSMYFVNFVHDFSPVIRAALEYDKVTTHYVSDGADPYDNRIQLSGLFRF